MEITPYAIPAMVALIGKASIYFYARYSRVQNYQTRLYLIFLFCLSVQSLAEITIFSNLAHGVANSPAGGTLWFAATIMAIALFLHLSLSTARNGVTGNERRAIFTLPLIYGPAVILEILLWCSSLLVVRFEPMSYTITKIPGRLYFLFELYVIGYLLIATALLIYRSCGRTVSPGRLQAKFLLIGLVPFVVLALAVIGLERLGFHEFNATITLPIATTFFLAVTAYATHQYRLFDIEFFIPWSKVRKRKTAFYNRIKTLIAEVADMTSVNAILRSLSEVLCCPIALVGTPKPFPAFAGEALGIARFPVSELKKINQIVVANEIAKAMPGTHALMRRHKVAAIVPFHPHSQTAASWMLLGESFSENVYSSLDFKNVEVLFARLADHFLDKQLLLRNQLTEAQEEMRALQQRLALAWNQIEELRKKLATTEQENRRLRSKSAEVLHADLMAIQNQMLGDDEHAPKSLEEHMTEFEARLIAKTLEYCEDDVSQASELLDLPLVSLYYKLRQYHLLRRGTSRRPRTIAD